MPYLLVTTLRVIAVAFGVLVISWSSRQFFETGDIFWFVLISGGYLAATVIWYVSKLLEDRYRYNITVPF